MSAVSESVQNYEEMSPIDLLKQMKDMMKVLEKKTKSSESKLKKLEEKEEKRASAAPAKGVRPSQLDANHSWVACVHKHMSSNGWEAFTHTERCGKGMADTEYPESEEIESDGVIYHVFRGVVPYAQANLSHAMTVSKKYKAEKPELYDAWKAEWDAEHPAEEKPAKVVKDVAPRVSMTLAEKLAEKAEKEAAKQAEKDRKAAERAEKKAAAEAEKAQKKLDAEEAKALKALNKPVKGGPKAAILRAAVPVAKPVVKALKPVAKPVVVKPVWIVPQNGQLHPWTVDGVMYLRAANNYMFHQTADEQIGECAGMYYPDTNTIDTNDVIESFDPDSDSDSDSDSE